MGRAHELATLLGASERLMDSQEIVFLFIGGGPRRAWVEQEASRKGLRNVLLKPYQPRAALSESLSVPDVHVVSLLPELEGCIVPSKFYGIAAAGRAVLFIGDTEGEIAAILREARCGESVSVGDSAGLVRLIVRLRDDPALAENWGANARRVLVERYKQAHALRAWEEVLLGGGEAG